MHALSGVHVDPKWKHVPAPPDWHVKYAAAPAWNTHDGLRQPMSRTTAGAPGAAGAGAVVTVVAVPADPLPAVVGRCGAGGFPQPIKTMATSSERTRR